MFVISLTYTKPLTVVDNLITQHAAFLDKYYHQGTFLMSGRKVPRTGGVILANCQSKQELQNIIEEDPFYSQGIADYDVTEFSVTKTSEQLHHFFS